MNATSDTLPKSPASVKGKYLPEYFVWLQLKQRCFNPRCKAFINYGGRGITVCKQWRKSWPSFIYDMGRRPSSNRSIDRIDNNAHYSCGKCEQCLANGWVKNCRWGTKEQQSNNKRTTTLLTHQGKTMSMKRWARHLGMPYGALQSRIHRGWPAAKALSEELQFKAHPLIEFEGQTMNLAGWSRKTGVDPDLILWRLNHRWSIRDALYTTPRPLRGPRAVSQTHGNQSGITTLGSADGGNL